MWAKFEGLAGRDEFGRECGILEQLDAARFVHSLEMRLVYSLEPIRCIMFWQGLGLVIHSVLCKTEIIGIHSFLISSRMPCSQGWHEFFKHVCQSNDDLFGRRTRDLPCESSAPTLSTSRSDILNCEKVEECHESKSSCP
jgi:hypothetical protein